MSAAIRILLADDQAMVRAGLAALLGREADFRVVAEVGTGSDALALASRLAPDVAVIDVDLRDMDGLEVLERLRVRCPQLPVLVLSSFHHPSYLRRALQAGAAGYLPKHLSAAELVCAVRAAARGGRVFATGGDATADPGLAYGRLALLTPRHSSLTEREREVLHMV